MSQPDGQHLLTVQIDERSLSPVSRDQEQERQVAIFDLLAQNHFFPVQGGQGPFDLGLSLIDGRLALDIAGPGYQRRNMLSLTALRGVIKDYFLVCETYNDAIRNATPHQIEALDMRRRALHDEGSLLLQGRLDGKVEVDMPTARRLFTLICSLHRRLA